MTPHLGLVVTVSVLPDSRRRLLVRLAPRQTAAASLAVGASPTPCSPLVSPCQTQIPVNVLKTSYDAVLQELGEGAT